MPEFESNLQQKKVENIQITRELFDQQQEQAWNIVKDFKDTNASLGKVVSKSKTKYDSMQITQLRDELQNDTKSKSKEYEEMVGQVNRLLELAQSKGMVTDSQGNQAKVSFYDCFYETKEAVDTYIFDHRGTRYKEKGERRYQIALRVKSLLNQMEGRLDDMQKALSSAEARKQNYAKLNLDNDEMKAAEDLQKVNAIAYDVTTFLKASDQKVDIPEEEVNSSIQTWVAKDYSSYLADMLDGKAITTKEDKNGFLAFMDKQNNRFVANKIAAQMLVDRKKDIYLGMPWLREKLESTLKRDLEAKDLFAKPAEFMVRVNEICDKFAEDNKQEIDNYRERSKQIITELNLPEDATDIYNFSSINKMLRAKESFVFRKKLNDLKAKMKPADAIIDEELKRRFSVATRSKIKDKLYKHLGILRVIGDLEQILTQTDMFFETLAFTSPEEYRVERRVSNFADKYNIDPIHRDAFINAVTNYQPEQFNPDNLKQYEKRATDYSKRIAKNLETARKLREAKGITYAENQWEEFEKIAVSEICRETKEYSKSLILALNTTVPIGQKVNLKEYQKKREQHAKENNKEVKKRRLIAKERNEALERDLGAKLYVHLGGDGNNIYLPYRKLAAGYVDNRKEVDQRTKQEETRYWQRKAALWAVLDKLGVEKKDYKIYENKFKWIMSGLDDVKGDMTPEESYATQRRNLEKFGVKDYKEALDKIAQISNIKEIDQNEKVVEARKLYDEGIAAIKNYDGNKYEDFADFIVSIPDVYKELLKGTDALNEFLKKTVDPKLENFMKGTGMARKAGEHKANKDENYISTAVRKQYAYQFIKSIYNGRLSGDAEFFRDHITNFQNKIFTVAPEGGVSVQESLKDALKQIEKLGKKAKLEDDYTRNIATRIYGELNAMVNTTEGLTLLTDKEAVKKFIEKRFKDAQTVKKADEVKDEVVKSFADWVVVGDTKEVADAKAAIRKNKEDGLKYRKAFLGMNVEKLQEVRLNKTLVRTMQKGEKGISLDPDRVKEMKQRVERICGDFDLPQVLMDALTEKASHGGLIKGFSGTNWKDTLLFSHGLAMRRMYDLLRVDRFEHNVGENGMGEEEVRMFIVKCYGNPTFVSKYFDKPRNLKVDDIIKSPEYKAFRSAYKKLVTLEKIQSDDPSLQEEMYGITKKIRTMLVTGMGVQDEHGRDMDVTKEEEKNVTNRIAEITDNSIKYVVYWNKVMEVVRPEFLRIHKEAADQEKSKKGDDLPQHYIDRQMAALRQYLMPLVMGRINNQFYPDYWKLAMEDFKKREYRDNLETDKGSVLASEEEQRERTALSGSGHDESDIENIINDSAYVLKGKVNKYRALSPDQKQLFAVALMHLHKSTLGLDSEGTSTLLASEELKRRGIGKLQEQIDNYIEGRAFHFDINYTDAVNNLVNYGLNVIGVSKYSMSDEAYEKAMKFVQAISAQKAMHGEKDMQRLEDPKYSVYAAYNIANKKQQTKIDALSKKDLDINNVKDIIIQNALADRITTKAAFEEVGMNTLKVYTGPLMAFRQIATAEKTIRINRRMDHIVKRFSAMSDGDMKMMVRILQERTVLDKSMIDMGAGPVMHVDEEKRNALLDALAGDASVSAETMKGFDSSEACLRAITTAMSFKLRDDLNFKGKELTQECFEKKSFNRKTIMDWDLLERAIKFFDEVMEKRAAIQAVKNSAELIKMCGNEKATKAHEKLKADFAKKEDFKQQNFEDIVSREANASESESVKNALAGFYALTPQQRILFFKALGQRDILDITKKDYWKLKGRNFVNQTGRDKLIDDFIASQKGDNIGMELEPQECYKAMEALYTTQISDRVRLTKVSDLKDIFSYERNFIMQRDTAIDWKLFKRALNFVNRASQELEMSEGNELLYRGAGDLEKNGQIKVNYSFLRRNFHKTGNQVMRKFIIGGGAAVKKQLDPDNKTGKILNTAVKVKKIAPKVGKILGFQENSYLNQGINKVADFAKEAKPFNDGELANDKALDTKCYLKIQEKIDDILKQDRTASQLMKDIQKVIDVTIQGEVGYEVNDSYIKEEATEAKKTDYVIEQGKNTKLDSSKGDIRDKVKKGQKIGKIVKGAVPIASKVVRGITPEQLKDIIKATDYAVEKATLKFMNDKVFGKEVNPNAENELKALKEAAGQYLEEVKDKVLFGYTGVKKQEYEAVKKQIEVIHRQARTRYMHQVSAAINGVYLIKSTVGNVMDIANSAMNIRTLNTVKKEKEDLKQGDKKKLDDAKANGRLDEAEKKKAENSADFNSAMGDTAASISKAMQALGIAEGTIRAATDIAKLAGGKLNLGSRAILKAIDSGLEFAHFAIRICTDQNALRDYYVHTKAGQAEVAKLKAGYKAAGNYRLHDEFDHYSKPKTKDTKLVKMIASAKGYEATSELVENTGMQMAQSIIFSASEFNPMAESKLMAITVLCVLKLDYLIGDTSPQAVQQLFKAFGMSR